MSVAESFLRPLAQAKWSPTFVVSCFVIFSWGATGLGPYSGYNTPPEFGDFEAQRHWMEITQHSPPSEWYFYDFDWWRLDYPPLTAYHSWACGKIGNFFDSQWFSLDTSRGCEVLGLKAFMRTTVIVSQLAAYAVPAYIWTRQIKDSMSRTSSFASFLIFPASTIVDHGHFQFNSVMLGLSMASIDALRRKRFVMSSILFILALFFKQMTLYYAPAIFFAISGFCIGPAASWELQIFRLVSVGLSVLLTAAVLLLPFRSPDQSHQILVRVFPVFRGLWEDKVANLWCTLNYTVFKFKANFEPHQLQSLALGATSVGIGPSCIAAFVGKPRVWVWAFASCAWSFFLFSFQVHEKSVLLPLLPTMMTAVQHYRVRNVKAMVNWINDVAYFSLWPLLKREGLQSQYFVSFVLYRWLFVERSSLIPRNWLNRVAVAGSYAAIFAITLAEHANLIPKPIALKYPDLLVVGNMTISFGCFLYFWLWQTWYMLTLTTIDDDK